VYETINNHNESQDVILRKQFDEEP